MADRPVIGEFRSKPDNKPRKEETPSSEPEVVVEPKKIDETGRLSPAEEYQKRLKEADISIDVARAIYDDVLSKGYYEETVSLKKGLRAVLRTRNYDDTLRLQTEFEAIQPRLQMTQEDMITRFNLAASLYEWKGENIAHGTDEDFDKALLLVKKLPGPVFSLLANELAKFDRKVMLVFSPGSTENFS